MTPDCPRLSAFKNEKPEILFIVNEDPETAPEIRSHNQDFYPNGTFRMVEVSVPLELEASVQLQFTVSPNQDKYDNNCGSAGNECCEWVAIWDCEEEVLPKTCSKDLTDERIKSINEKLAVSWYTRTLQVYIRSDGLKEGQRGWTLKKSVIETPKFTFPSPSECMYDCTWQPNPFYRRS